MRKVEEIDQPDIFVVLRVDIETDSESPGQFVNRSKHKAHSATINYLNDNKFKTLILGHDRINSGHDAMKNHAKCLTSCSDAEVEYVGHKYNVNEAFEEMERGDFFLYKNLSEIDGCVTEYETLKESADINLIDIISKNADAYVNDTFALSDMKYPSITGIPFKIPGYAGKSLNSEYELIKNITEGQENATFHFSGKTELQRKVRCMNNLLESDQDVKILVSGILGSAFLSSNGYDLGENTTDDIDSLMSQETKDRIYEMITRFAESIYTPNDLVVQDPNRSEYSVTATPLTHSVQDIGDETVELYSGLIDQSQYVMSTGIVEDYVSGYSSASERIYREISDQEYGIIAGYKTVDACDRMGYTGFSHTTMDFKTVCDYISGKDISGIRALLS